LEDVIESSFDYEIRNQGEDGSWTPNWSWGKNYPADWEIARVEWAGILTLEKLVLLKRYGRIDP
jgi:hypothetical protein